MKLNSYLFVTSYAILSRAFHHQTVRPLTLCNPRVFSTAISSSSSPSSSSTLRNDDIKSSCLAWVNEFVIEHKLCPWAKESINKLNMELIDTEPINNAADSIAIELLYEQIMIYAQELIESPTGGTTLIVLPKYSHSFEDFLEVSTNVENLLEASGLATCIQLASFHPHYGFKDDNGEESIVSAYTNRSPYPMLHYLLVKDVENAISDYARQGRTMDHIWQNNIKKMNSLSELLGGEEAMRSKLETFKKS